MNMGSATRAGAAAAALVDFFKVGFFVGTLGINIFWRLVILPREQIHAGKGSRALDGLRQKKFNLILPTGQDFLVENRQGEFRSQQAYSDAITSRCQIRFWGGRQFGFSRWGFCRNNRMTVRRLRQSSALRKR